MHKPLKKINKNHKRDIMQLFNADTTMFLKEIEKKNCLQKAEKKPSKVAQK